MTASFMVLNKQRAVFISWEATKTIVPKKGFASFAIQWLKDRRSREHRKPFHTKSLFDVYRLPLSCLWCVWQSASLVSNCLFTDIDNSVRIITIIWLHYFIRSMADALIKVHLRAFKVKVESGLTVVFGSLLVSKLRRERNEDVAKLKKV